VFERFFRIKHKQNIFWKGKSDKNAVSENQNENIKRKEGNEGIV